MDDVLKFSYLKSYLRDQALSAVSGLTLTSANYKTALDILVNRFGNKQLLINANVEKLMNIEPVTSAKDIKKVRNIYDTIEVHVRNLTSLDIDTRHYGPVLISVIMAKVPEEIRRHLSRAMPTSDQWDVDELLQRLKIEIDSREICSNMSTNNSNQSSHSEPLFAEEEEVTATFLIGDNVEQGKQGSRGGQGGPKVISCTYCKRNHPSSKCNVVTEVQARKNILRNKSRCFVCLRSGHVGRNCKSKLKCHRCNGRHHISICEDSSHSGPQSSSGGSNVPKAAVSTVGAVVPAGGGAMSMGGGAMSGGGGYFLPMMSGGAYGPTPGGVAPTTVATAPVANGAAPTTMPPPQYFQYVPYPDI